MNVLIAYASRTGTTARCARMLADRLAAQDVTLCDIESDSIPPLDGFDFVALGAPVRYGKLPKSMRAFMHRHREELLSRRTGYFICCAYIDSAPEYLRKLIPAELARPAAVTSCLGGEIDPRRVRGLDRLVVRMIVGAIRDSGEEEGLIKVANLPAINPDNIERFADAVKASFRRR